MAHASSSTFIKHYRVRRHAGLQEIMCGLNPDEEFSRAVTRMSRWIDRRRPRYLNDDDRALVEKDPELQAAMRWQVGLESQCNRSNDPTLREMLEDQKRRVHNLRRSLQGNRRKQVRRDFSRKQAVIDIQRQLTGGAVDDEPAREVLREEFGMPPAHVLLVEALFTWPTSDSLEQEWARRNKAVAAGSQYCGFPEGGPLRGRRKKRSTPSDEDEERIASHPCCKQKSEEMPTISVWEEEPVKLENNVESAARPVVCFQCKKDYSDHYGVKRHFRNLHLQDCKCNACDDEVLFQHEMHLQRHAQVVHRLCT